MDDAEAVAQRMAAQTEEERKKRVRMEIELDEMRSKCKALTSELDRVKREVHMRGGRESRAKSDIAQPRISIRRRSSSTHSLHLAEEIANSPAIHTAALHLSQDIGHSEGGGGMEGRLLEDVGGVLDAYGGSRTPLLRPQIAYAQDRIGMCARSLSSTDLHRCMRAKCALSRRS